MHRPEPEQERLLAIYIDMELALKCSDNLWLLSKNGGLAVGALENLVLDGTFALLYTPLLIPNALVFRK